MTRDEAYLLVKEVITDVLCIESDTFTLSSDLENDLGLDSLDKIELLSNVEEKFNFSVDEAILAPINSVDDVVNIVLQVSHNDAA